MLGRIWHEAFFPAVCIHCKRFLHLKAAGSAAFSKDIDHDDLLANLFCRQCMAEIRLIRSPKCPVCGIPFWGAGEKDHICTNCTEHPRPFVSSEAIGIYEGPLRSAIHALKYDGRLRVARMLSPLLYLLFVRSHLYQTVDMIVPVPLHPARLRMRGFNQSILLVRGWERFAGNDVGDADRPIVCREALRRVRNTKPQMSLGKKERQTNIAGAFELHPDVSVEGRRILIVDDVLTTGVTVAECATVLLKAGAAKVDVLTAARAIE